MDNIVPKKSSSVENVLYFIIFGIILVILAYYVLKHLKYMFILGLKKVDEYVLNKSGLDKEDFAVSIPNTPSLFVLNTSLGSAVSFKPIKDISIIAYLCTITNTSNQDTPIQLKTIKNIEGLTNEQGYIVIDLPELNNTDVYSIVIKPITKEGTGIASNTVYAYKKDDDTDATFLETTPLDDNLDNYNFSSDITQKIYK